MHERELERERRDDSGTRDDKSTPGRASWSATLDGPRSPLPSGILRKAERDASGVTGDAEHHVERAASSSGAPLPTEVRSRFERSLGADLSSVRVHTGQESAVAAHAVGAKAYTIGQNVHFSAGRYDTSSREGMSLLAHEVAHTVQQAGGSQRRQNKLEVSSAGDSAELEADAAAEAMLEGREASIGGATNIAHRASIFRGEEDEEDPDAKLNADNKAWAEEARPQVQDVVDTTAAAIERVNADAEAAITSIEAAKTSYSNYETKYEAALDRFKKGVEAAQKQSKELQDAVSIVANVALGATFPMLAATKSAIGGVLETANNAATVAGVVGLVPKAAEKGGESDKNVGPSGKVDWKALLQTTITAFKTYLQQNKALTSLAKEAGSNERYLSSVIEGEYDGQDAQATDRGAKAAEMAVNHMTIGVDLDGLSGDEVSSPASTFADEASSALDALTPNKIEQDIAIKWISGLDSKQRDEIDTADDYLKRLGVIDAKGNRLDYDTGGYTLDGDEVMVHLRAQVEQMAMNAAGNTGEWLGGNGGVGWVNDANGVKWPAQSKETISDKPGGQVLLVSYAFSSTQDIGDGMSRPGSEMEIKQKMVNRCMFTIKPLGETGGGVYDGPVVRPK